jgi:hypothetical protein
MASPLTGPLRGVARTLLGTFGGAATLRRPGADGSYDPATGQITGGSSAADYPCEVQLVEFRESQIDGTLIKAADKKALVSSLRLGVDPVPQSDVLIVGDETWQILGDAPASSGTTPVLHTLHVRR